jgi:probable HAF family extracellular repeat protein
VKLDKIAFSLRLVVWPTLLLIGSAPSIWAQQVKIYDLGHYPTGTAAAARDINNAGVVVGYGDIDGGYFRPIGAPISGPNAGQWFDLGTLGGERKDYSVMCMAIADNGMIVGHSAISDAFVHAFAWTKQTGMVDIGTLSGHTQSLAYGTNKSGTLVVGFSGTGFFTEDNRPVVWAPRVKWTSSGPATTWEIQELDTAGFEGATSWTAIYANTSGQIIGAAKDSGGGYIPVVWNPVRQGNGWKWKITGLPVLTNSHASPAQINEKGEIVGTIFPADNPAKLPALWQPDRRQKNAWNLTVLPTLSGFPAGPNEAFGINNRGDIVGYSFTLTGPFGPTVYAARWSTKDLGTVQVLGFTGMWSYAVSVNDNGIAAGAYGSGPPNDQMTGEVAAIKIK